MPAVAAGMVALGFTNIQFAEGGPLFASVEGPGAAHAPKLMAFGAALLVGFLAQRSRFCTIGSFRDVFLMRDFYLMKGVIALVVAAAAANLLLGQFKAGFADQPIAHTMHLWNFAGLLLVGLAATLAGGCPARQLILSGEGDGDAGIFVLGMLTGAAFSHNMSAASSPAGVGAFGPAAVILGLVVSLGIGFAMMARAGR
jgi:hypothetical protein